MRWLSGLLAQVKLRGFNLTGEPGDPGVTALGQVAGQSRRGRFSAQHGGPVMRLLMEADIA